MKKSKSDISIRARPSVGLLFTPDKSGIAVDWSQLPASDHFFLATHFNLKMTPSGLKVLFGTKSDFDQASQNFDLAVEIHMPTFEAYTCIYRNVFEELSGNGKTTFYDALTNELEKRSFTNGTNNVSAVGIGLPQNRGSSFRIFPSNFAGIAFNGLQGMIEFFEIPPDLLHHFRRGHPTRPGAGVKPVISVVVDSMLLRNFLSESRAALQSLRMEGAEK